MKAKSILKDYRLMILIALIVMSALALSIPTFFKKSGIYISYISEDAKCTGVTVGARLNEVNSKLIQSYDDFSDALKNVKKGDYVPLVVNGMPANCIAIDDGNLGFTVKKVEPSALKFGIDISGGTKVILKPTNTNVTMKEIYETSTILEERINMYGLSDIHVIPIGNNLIEIQAAGLTRDDIENFLAKQGIFEGKILEVIDLVNGKGVLIFDGKKYDILAKNNTITLLNKTYRVNDTFELENVTFEIHNITSDYVSLYADVFTGKDIVNIFTDPQHNYITPYGDGYRFAFAIQISKESAEKFAKITKGQPTYFSGGEAYIKPKIVLFLDGKPVTQLNIAGSLAGQPVSTPLIEGWRKTSAEAEKEKLRLQTILRSGSLPVKLEIVKADTITQTAGERMIHSTVYVFIIASIAVATIIFIRYRKLKISIPIVALTLSEILIILGIAASQVLAVIVILSALFIGIYYKEIKGFVGWTAILVALVIAGYVVVGKWTLDIPSIAGLIGVLGTGTTQMIIITDEILLNKEKSIDERKKTAMEIISGSAYLVIFAMAPLVFLGIGTLKGFGITTIIGVLVGFLITRPAYMSIIERLSKND